MLRALTLPSFHAASWRGCRHHPHGCWTESRPISCCLLAHRYYGYLQQGHHNNISASIAQSHVVPVPPPSPTPPPTAAFPTDNNSEETGYSGRLRSSMRPKLDDRETGKARSRSRDSRWGEPPEEGSADDTWDGPQHHPPDSSTKRDELPVLAGEEADQPRADSGASRRKLSPAPGKRHQLASPRPTERQPRSSRDRSAYVDPSDMPSEAKRIQRVLEDAKETSIRRMERQRQNEIDIERAQHAERKASVAAEGAQQALAQAVASAAAEATTPPPPATRLQGVASQKQRPGDGAFLKGNVVGV